MLTSPCVSVALYASLRRQFPHAARFLDTIYCHPTVASVLHITLHPPQEAAKLVPKAAHPWGNGPHPLAQLLEAGLAPDAPWSGQLSSFALKKAGHLLFLTHNML